MTDQTGTEQGLRHFDSGAGTACGRQADYDDRPDDPWWFPVTCPDCIEVYGTDRCRFREMPYRAMPGALWTAARWAFRTHIGSGWPAS
jgi:hypothetical protein